MKYGLFYITLVFCLVNNAYAKESNMNILISGESLENGNAASLGMYVGDDYFYGGLSLNYITSSTVIQRNNRKTIYPIYLFMGIKAPWKVSPYIEAGIDLPEALIDDLLDNNEENGGAQADYYFSGGLLFSATKTLSISLYAKQYHFTFRENIYAPTTKTDQLGYGVGLSISF